MVQTREFLHKKIKDMGLKILKEPEILGSSENWTLLCKMGHKSKISTEKLKYLLECPKCLKSSPSIRGHQTRKLIREKLKKANIKVIEEPKDLGYPYKWKIECKNGHLIEMFTPSLKYNSECPICKKLDEIKKGIGLNRELRKIKYKMKKGINLKFADKYILEHEKELIEKNNDVNPIFKKFIESHLDEINQLSEKIISMMDKKQIHLNKNGIQSASAYFLCSYLRQPFHQSDFAKYYSLTSKTLRKYIMIIRNNIGERIINIIQNYIIE